MRGRTNYTTTTKHKQQHLTREGRGVQETTIYEFEWSTILRSAQEKQVLFEVDIRRAVLDLDVPNNIQL